MVGIKKIKNMSMNLDIERIIRKEEA